MLISFVIWTILIEWVYCQTPFNVDLKFPIVLPSSSVSKELLDRNRYHPSLFGSSIAVTNVNQSVFNVFIGSPYLRSKKNSSIIVGGVFRCAVQVVGAARFYCNEIDFQNVVQQRRNVSFTEKSKTLLGFTLSVTSTDTIACAPNWVNDELTPVGLCFSIDSKTGRPKKSFKFPIKSPFKSKRPFESHNLFGLSQSYNKLNDELVMGIPGYSDFGGSLSLADSNLNVIKFKDSKVRVNSYSGYSVAWYTFDGIMAIVTGSPKANGFNGKVDIIDSDSQTILFTLLGRNDSHGEYFGFSIMVTDIDGDNKGDILIGAPLYSQHNKRETGRVYLFQNVMENLHRKFHGQVFTSKESKVGARFGTSIAMIDIDKNKYQDAVISAPFESNSDSSSGAIYIFYGSPNGLDISSEKRIGAEKISNNLFGFGYSLWTQADIDQNEYNDLIVGSLISEKVFILRTKRVLKYNLTLTFDKKGVNLTDNSHCLNQNSCFRARYCINTDSVTDFADELTFLVNFTVPDRKLRLKESRVLNDKQNSVVRTRYKSICMDGNDAFYVDVRRKEDIYDITTPIEVQLTVELYEAESKSSQFCSSCPIASPVTIFREIGFEHGCVRKHCLSKLSLNVDFKYGPNQIDEDIIEGKFTSIDATIKISNFGESSIDTTVSILMNPLVLQFIENIDSLRCSPNQERTGFICDVNKLLLKDQKEEIILRFSLFNINVHDVDFEFELNSKSLISGNSKTKYSKRIHIAKEVSFELQGIEQYNYSFSDQTPKVIFPISLAVEKNGPSTVYFTYLEFYLPSLVVEIQQTFISKYRCIRMSAPKKSAFKPKIINGTMNLVCIDANPMCAKYQCNLNRLEVGYQRINFDLSLVFHPHELPTKTQYDIAVIEMQVDVYTVDIFLKSNTSHASMGIWFDFERQQSLIKSRSQRVIMFGGAGFGLLIVVIIVIILIKYGFFKRKRREELRKVKQRMSMNPNLFPVNINDEDDDDEDQESDQTTNQ